MAQEKAVRKKQKKRMRLPPGVGSVHKIGDDKNRRKPWRARVPAGVDYDMPSGTATRKYINIGYFETEVDAIEALMKYRSTPYSVEASKATFLDVFTMWKEENYKDFSDANKSGYNSAMNNSAPLHKKKMRDIRTQDMQIVMNTIEGGVSLQKRLKTFWGQIFKYAMQRDIVQKNYSEFVKIRDKDEGTTRRAIPDEDRKKIWDAVGKIPDADLAIIYCYTGMRPSELLEVKKENVDLEKRIMVGGKKTKAGKDRHIPIHKSIVPLIEKRLADTGEYLVTRDGGKRVNYEYFRRYIWAPLMASLGMDYTGHECRHTCATMMREAKIEEDLRKLILGHANGDITDRYTHTPDYMLVDAIDSIPEP